MKYERTEIINLLEKVNQRMTSIRKGNMEETCPIGIIDFNTWEWAQGVGLYGMFQEYQETKSKEILEYLVTWYRDRIREGLPEKNVNTMAPMLTLSLVYEETGIKEFLELCEEWAEWVMNSMPRTKEGGLQHIVSGHRNEQQLWDDTLFMTVLFLGKMGRLLGRKDYLEEADYQFLLHIKYLSDRKTGLWFHGWTFQERNHFAGALWARGNSWITAGIPDYLDMAKPEGAVKRFLLQALDNQIQGLVKVQKENGMWTTLLDEPDSYEETSATAGIAYGILKAVRMKYVDESYRKNGIEALKAVIERIAEDGTVQGVSYGTGMGADREDYRKIPLCPMPYGQALASLLLIEALKLWEDA